jgi:hypothetical protein
VDVVELLRGARVATVRATVRVRGGGHERTVEVWLQPPDRAREETRDADSRSFGVRRGRTWWWWDAFGGAFSNEDRPEHGNSLGEEFAWLVDASFTIPFLDLGEITRGTCAGRPTLRVWARQLRDDGALDDDWIGGLHHDEVLLDVDGERGVLLRVESRISGVVDEVAEVMSVTFDEPIPEETFVFTPPAGERVQSTREFGRTTNIELEEAVALASFPVWIAPAIPPGWELMVDFRPGQLRLLQPPAVFLWYFPPDGSDAAVVIRQQRGYGRPTEVHEEPGWAEVHVERDGTAIHLGSRTLGAEALTGWADRLGRARA